MKRAVLFSIIALANIARAVIVALKTVRKMK